MSLKSIVQVLGGELYDGGCRANIPAPGHSRADRSVSLLLRGGRIVVHTFGDGDWRIVLDDLRRQGLVDIANAPTRSSGGGAGAVASRASNGERLATARRLWESSRPLTRTLAGLHCRLRGVTRPLPGFDVLRHHAEMPVAVYGESLRSRPALLVAIRDSEGIFTALEATYLAPNGRRAADIRLSRKTIGAVPPGTAARLDPAAPNMLVAEGVFTTLAATEHFGLPGWALMSTRNLRTWSAPAGVHSVLIAADRGKDGEASAEVLLGRLNRQGVRARIVLPPAPHGDWNEAATAPCLARAG